MMNISIQSGLDTGVQYVEELLDVFPDNPLRDPFGQAWSYMTDNYSQFQMSTFGTLIIHEVSHLTWAIIINDMVYQLIKTKSSIHIKRYQ